MKSREAMIQLFIAATADVHICLVWFMENLHRQIWKTGIVEEYKYFFLLNLFINFTV